MTDFAITTLPAPADATAVTATLYAPGGAAVATLALTHSGGTWSGSVTLSPAPADSAGLPYTFAVVAAVPRGTPTLTLLSGDYGYLVGGAWYDVPDAASPAGRYATLADWDNWAGSPNVESYSDKAGAGQLNAASVQAAMDYADGELETALQSVYAVPLSPVTPRLRYWATVIGVGRYEYFGRGLSDADKSGDRFAKAVAQVYREMRAALAPPGLLPCAKRAGVTFGVSNAQVSRARRVTTDGACWGRW